MKKLPSIKQDFSQWYNDVVYEAELADQSPVRGTIVIRPYGWALWENIKDMLDEKLKETGHQNAAFPLFIPQSFLEKEAKHVEGFAPECAVVTHAGGKELEEPLVVRPTSETIIHYMFARWIHSWRDLPLKINQWANVVRWEMRPRPFLRTTEFFWQEGHTAHETRQDALDEINTIYDIYIELIEEHLAIPLVIGVKSPHERFPGAEETYTMEALMQDGKALQMGTLHLLSQSFAESFEMAFQNREGARVHPFLTSWGVTTRLIGATVMTHGDDKGLILPPAIAPVQVVIVPIFKTDADKQEIMEAIEEMREDLDGLSIVVDDDPATTPGAKFYKWELKGVPLRIEIGPRDVKSGVAVLVDRLGMGKKTVPLEDLEEAVVDMLETIQTEMFERAKKRLDASWRDGQDLAVFGPELAEKAGAYRAGWCGVAACESELKQYQGTIRCLLKDSRMKNCFHCKNPSSQDVFIAKAY